MIECNKLYVCLELGDMSPEEFEERYCTQTSPDIAALEGYRNMDRAEKIDCMANGEVGF